MAGNAFADSSFSFYPTIYTTFEQWSSGSSYLDRVGMCLGNTVYASSTNYKTELVFGDSSSVSSGTDYYKVSGGTLSSSYSHTNSSSSSVYGLVKSAFGYFFNFPAGSISSDYSSIYFSDFYMYYNVRCDDLSFEQFDVSIFDQSTDSPALGYIVYVDDTKTLYENLGYLSSGYVTSISYDNDGCGYSICFHFPEISIDLSSIDLANTDISIVLDCSDRKTYGYYSLFYSGRSSALDTVTYNIESSIIYAPIYFNFNSAPVVDNDTGDSGDTGDTGDTGDSSSAFTAQDIANILAYLSSIDTKLSTLNTTESTINILANYIYEWLYGQVYNIDDIFGALALIYTSEDEIISQLTAIDETLDYMFYTDTLIYNKIEEFETAFIEYMTENNYSLSEIVRILTNVDSTVTALYDLIEGFLADEYDYSSSTDSMLSDSEIYTSSEEALSSSLDELSFDIDTDSISGISEEFTSSDVSGLFGSIYTGLPTILIGLIGFALVLIILKRLFT